MISRLSFDVIDTHDFKTLGVLDTSWYNAKIKVENPTIEILPPGYKLAASPFYMVNALNIFNSNSVGITHASCEEELIDLPDGIWKIKYSICPNDKLFIERIFLKTDKIRCRYSQAFLNLDLRSDEVKDKTKMKNLNEIEFYIDGAVAAANNQDSKLSIDLYNKAEKLLDKYFSKCNC
jgi:hypothetical protein